ncbi:MAG: ABC transporter permease [Pseudomonadota bacterium]
MKNSQSSAATQISNNNAEQPTITIIEANSKKSLIYDLTELWSYRELFFTMALRNIKVRYKQSVLGILWVIVQPIVTCLVFTFVFGYIIKIHTGKTPYPVFVFSGLLLWQFFTRNLTEGVASLVSHSNFINKVYFPRIGIPLIGILSSTMDFILALFVLFVLMLWFHVAFHWQLIFVPVILLFTFALSYSATLIFAPLNAIYRDIGLMIGYCIQFLMYLSPVIYPVSFIPHKYQWLYDFNPVATLLNAMRWALIGTTPPSNYTIGILCITTFLCFIAGRKIFRTLEPTIVDRI